MSGDFQVVTVGRGRRFRVIDASGRRLGTYGSRGAAEGAIAALKAEARQAALATPDGKAKSSQRAAYRAADSDPTLRALKRFLPRTGATERATQNNYNRTLTWLDGKMTVTSSAVTLNSALKRTLGQRRTAPATEARAGQGGATDARVALLWSALADVPARRRATRIATELGKHSDTIRRIRRRLGLH